MTVKDATWSRAEDAEVVERANGMRIRTLWTGDTGAKVQIVEIDPGGCRAELDVHESGPEEVYVISGLFNDGVRDYAAGTFIHNPTGSSHVPQSKTGCVLFLFYPDG